MIDPSLENYLKSCKAHNLAFEIVVTELERSGWDQSQIAEARLWYYHEGKTHIDSLSNQPAADFSQTSVPADDSSIGFTFASPEMASSPTQNTFNNPANNRQENPRLRQTSSLPKIPLLFAGLVLLLFILAVPGFAYLVTSGKITTDNEFINKTSNTIAFFIPFFPKTPNIVLARTFMAHQKVARNTVDFSMAVSSDDFMEDLGLNSLDFELKGYTDYADFDNPRFDFSLFVTKDFGVDIRKNDELIYFKINKLPTLLLTMFGMNEEMTQPLLNRWVVYDPTPLDTQAQKELKNLRQPKSPTDELTKEMMTKFLSEDILPKIKMSQENLDNYKTYKLEFKPDANTLDTFFDQLEEQMEDFNPNVLGAYTDQVSTITDRLVASAPKSSDYIKDFVITTWIDKKDFYLRKFVVSFAIIDNSIKPTNYSSDPLSIMNFSQANIKVVSVLKLDDFGKEIKIETPSDAISVEDFAAQIFGSAMVLDSDKQFSLSRDSVRRVDVLAISNAIYQFSAEHNGSLPQLLSGQIPRTNTCIGSAPPCFDLGKAGFNQNGVIVDAIVPKYISEIPRDPKIGTNENTQYYFYINQNNRIVVTATSENDEADIMAIR
jgi:hypothetical protein